MAHSVRQITVDVDKKCNTWTIVDEAGIPDPTHSQSGREEWFTWISSSGGLTIEFPRGKHPFKSDPNQSVPVGTNTRLVQVDKTKIGAWKYNVAVKLENGHECEKDPQVWIDSGVDPTDNDLELLLAESGGVSHATRDIVVQLFRTLAEAGPSKPDAPKFFPDGIELISVDVQVGVVKVSVEVAGPKAANK